MFRIAVVLPHGDEVLLPEPGAEILHRNMKEIGRKIKEEGIEEYILITPHNIRIDTHLGVILTEYAGGSWKYRNLRFRRTYECNRKLAKRIYEEAKNRNIPVVGINFGALEGTMSKMPLDWGSLIPLYFLPRRRLVLITPARKIERHELVEFGEILGSIMEGEKKKIALVISADHAHAHSRDGPYGYSRMAALYDSLVLDSIRNNSLSEILNIEDGVIEGAKPDSFWQLLILHGAIGGRKMKVENIAYACPTYFGMATALFRLG